MYWFVRPPFRGASALRVTPKDSEKITCPICSDDWEAEGWQGPHMLEVKHGAKCAFCESRVSSMELQEFGVAGVAAARVAAVVEMRR